MHQNENQPKPTPEQFTHNGVLMQPHYDNAVRAWEKMDNIEPTEIIEGNKLIAAFMGYYITDFNGRHHFVCKEKKKPEHLNQSWEFRLEEAEYHTSWDWLMPVVEKIEGMNGLFQIIIKTQWVKIHKYDPFNSFDISVQGIPPNSKIQAVHKAVIDFIKWYNQNK